MIELRVHSFLQKNLKEGKKKVTRIISKEEVLLIISNYITRWKRALATHKSKTYICRQTRNKKKENEKGIIYCNRQTQRKIYLRIV